MRLSPLLTILVAVIAVVVIGVGAALILQPPRALLTSVRFAPDIITPNGDGVDDATQISYTLNRNAKLTIQFKNDETGRVFNFRNADPRGSGSYQVLFSGIVNGYTLPDDAPNGGDIQTRLIPNGIYTWLVAAETDTGEKLDVSGKLTIKNADTALPLIQGFSVSPQVFTPNQDGIDDRVAVNAFLPKKADLSIYLLDASGTRYDLPERIETRDPGDPGAHVFDYDGGLDNNVEPPPNGDYTLVAEAQDVTGQRVRQTRKLTIRDGGLPQVEIQPQTSGAQVFWTSIAPTTAPIAQPQGVMSTEARLTMIQNDWLVFRLTVSNYGNTPLRTLAPWPGTAYKWNEIYSGKLDPLISRSGVWFVGVQCDISESSFPYRWAIGTPEQLTKQTDSEGQAFYYLMPGQRATVWGAIEMSKLVKSRNPTECFAALIHEDKEIPPLQSHVGPIKVELAPAP
jgi:hypothetical protein